MVQITLSRQALQVAGGGLERGEALNRDMDLIKAILLELEKHTPGTIYNAEDFKVEGSTPEEVHFHLYLLKQAGLIHALNVTGGGTPVPEMIPFWLTWDGYEFLDAARNEGIWNKAKGVLADKGLGMPFDILKSLLLKLGQEAIS